MLGRMLRKIMRGTVPGTGRGHKGEKSKGAARPTFKAECKRLGLKETSGKEAQRIGTLPRFAGDFLQLRPIDKLRFLRSILQRLQLKTGRTCKNLLETMGPGFVLNQAVGRDASGHAVVRPTKRYGTFGCINPP